MIRETGARLAGLGLIPNTTFLAQKEVGLEGAGSLAQSEVAFLAVFNADFVAFLGLGLMANTAFLVENENCGLLEIVLDTPGLAT